MRNNRLLWTLVLLIALIGLTVSAQEVDGLVRRQDEETGTTPIRVRSSSTTAPSKTEEEDSTITPAPTEDEADSDSEDKNTKEGTKEDEGAGTTSIRVRSSSESIRTRGTVTKVNPNSPTGNIGMVSPATSDGFQLYPIGTQITWVYNYTGVLISPTAVNIEAFISRTQQLYTIAHNYSSKATTVVWDTEEYEKTGNPRIAGETYTLYIYDNAIQKTSIPEAGKLGIFNTFTFAMYTPKGNTPLSEYVCPTCNDASSLLQSHSFKVLLGTSLFVTMGFAWFVHGAV